MKSKETMELVRSYYAIGDSKHRKDAMAMLRNLAKMPKSAGKKS